MLRRGTGDDRGTWCGPIGAGEVAVVRSTTLRELLDQWWADDPAGPPSGAERAAARAELGLPKPGLPQ